MERINELSVARNTAKDGIIVVDKDVADQFLQDLRQARMTSICLDESTDVKSAACSAVTARSPPGDMVAEELIKWITHSEKTTVEDIINALKKEFI